MHWGKRRYHRESYFTRQQAKYKRRLRKRLIPGYGQHRKYDMKQWRNRVHERYYRRHTYPSQSERMRRWAEGYSYRSHPRISRPRTTRRTYRRRSRTGVDRKPHISRAEQIKNKEALDSDPVAGGLGCGCSSFLIAIILGLILDSWWVALVILIIGGVLTRWAVQGAHLNRKKFAKQHAEQKQSLADSCKTSRTSSASSNSASSANSRAGSASSIRSSYIRAGSLANSTTDSLAAELDSVVSASNRGKGFDTEKMHHAVSDAGRSLSSIYNDDPSMLAFSKNHLSAMDSEITQAGSEFNGRPSSVDAHVTINFSVHGLSNDDSASQSAATSSSVSNNHSGN